MRDVRQRCGFGCVNCGCAIIQYHHFDPEYAEATEHRAESITLLCGTCHDHVNRGLLGIDEVRLLNGDPKCKRQGFTGDLLFASRDKIHFQIGSATFRRHAVLLYEEEVLIGFAPAIDERGPLRLFAKFTDEEGKLLFVIHDNYWSVGVDQFDVQTEGRGLTIRKKLGDIVLRMLLNPGGEIVLDRLRMTYAGFHIAIEDGRFNLTNGRGGRFVLVCPNIHSTMRLDRNGGVRV